MDYPSWLPPCSGGGVAGHLGGTSLGRPGEEIILDGQMSAVYTASLWTQVEMHIDLVDPARS